MSNNSDFIPFVRSRLNELHPLVFHPHIQSLYDEASVKVARLTYYAYLQYLNSRGLGRDYSHLPQLKLPIL